MARKRSRSANSIDKQQQLMTKQMTQPKQYSVHTSDVAAFLAGAMESDVRNSQLLQGEFAKMLDGDESISTGMEYLCYSVVKRLGEFKHENTAIVDFQRQCVNTLEGTMADIMREILMYALGYGYSVAETTLVAQDARWLLRYLPVLDPLTCTFVMRRDPSTQRPEITMVKQQTAAGDVEIPRHKCVIYSYGTSRTPYGRPRLSMCYRWYAFKKATLRFWAIALEKFGMPTIVGKGGDAEAMLDAIQNIYAKSSIVIGPDDSLDYLEKMAFTSQEYESAIAFCNKMMYRAMFLPALLESGEKGGSYSLGKVHLQMYEDSCKWLAKEVSEVLIEQLWRPLILVNFGPQESYGEFPISNNFSSDEQEIMSRIFLNATNSGIFVPEDDLVATQWARERLGFPRTDVAGRAPSTGKEAAPVNQAPAGGNAQEKSQKEASGGEPNED